MEILISLWSKFTLVVREIDWAISLLAAIPLAVIANLLTPKFSNWVHKRSENRTKLKQKEIQFELERIHKYVMDQSSLQFETYSKIFRILFNLSIGSFLAAFPFLDIFTGPVAALFFLRALNIAYAQIRLLEKCRDFSKYESRMKAELSRLENEVPSQRIT